MTTLGAKMSYPGMSSSYQSYHQPVRHHGLSNGHHMGSYPHNSRFSQQQQPAMVQSKPASFPVAFPYNAQGEGDRWLPGVSLAPKDNKEDSTTIIKSEPSSNTEIPPPKADSPNQSSQPTTVNNANSKQINPNNMIRLPGGALPQPSIVNTYTLARPPGTVPQPHGMVKPQIQRTWTRVPGGVFPQAQSARTPGGVFPQARTPVNSQTIRTWIPARQPFLENSPRAPGTPVLTPRLQNNQLKPLQQPGGYWVVDAKCQRNASVIFKKADADNDGYVSGLEVRDFFIRTGLSQENLIHIWDLVDTKQEGRLNCEQFALAMWITARTATSGIPPPKKLAPEMIPPSMRVKASPQPISNANKTIMNETISSPNTLLSNIMQHSKNGKIPKPNILVKPKKVTAKISRPGLEPIEDVYGCPNCSIMYDDSQHSPRQLPCSHTFCIDCLDMALEQDVIKCFTCKTPHKTLAAADFPVNVFTVELLKRFIEGKSEEERKKYVHDADSCFYCENDHEPPLKRAKFGSKKHSCNLGSSQENEPSKGCEVDNKDATSDTISAASQSRVTFDGSEIDLNSASVLKNGSQGKEKYILSSGLEAGSLDTSGSNNSGSKEGGCNASAEENLIGIESVDYSDRLSNKKDVQSSAEVNINKGNTLKTKVNEVDIAHTNIQNNHSANINKDSASIPKETVLNTSHSELQNKWLSSIQARERANENQRAKPKEPPSKIDENMNSLSVDKFLEEIL